MTNNKLSITFEDINPRYSKGTFLDNEVIVMKKNGYPNGSKFCTKYDKELRRYFETKRSEKAIEDITEIYDIPENQQYIMIEGGEEHKLLGKYVHPYLLVDIAEWISRPLRRKIFKIINDYNIEQANKIKEELAKKDEIINKQKNKIKEQDSEIKKLQDMMSNFTKSAGEKLDDIKKNADEKYGDLKKDTTKIIKKSDKLLKSNKEISRKLNVVVKDRVLKTGDQKDVNHLNLIGNGSDKKK